MEGLAFELICVVPLYFSTSFEILENQRRSRVSGVTTAPANPASGGAAP